MRTKFTASFIADATLGTHFDTHTPGLMLYVGKRRRTWRFKADQWINGKKKTVQPTLGCTDTLTLSQARAAAQRIRADINDGIDAKPAQTTRVTATSGSITVEEAFKQACDVLTEAGRTPGTVQEIANMCEYFDDWAQRPLAGIKRSEIRKRHSWITNNGLKKKATPSAANHAMKAFRRVWNVAAAYDDENTILKAHNPVEGLIMNPESPREVYIGDLPEWWERLATLESPLRQKMHAFGLLSGLRPGNLLKLRRSWRTASDRLTIPRPDMKNKKAAANFILPLSEPMQMLLDEAVVRGDMFFDPKHHEHGYFWPSRSLKGTITHVQKPYQKELLFDGVMLTGHALRHTYRSHAEAIPLPDNLAAALIDHSKAGAAGHYVHREAMFKELMAAQVQMTERLTKS